MENQSARVINVILGAWLIISSFVWPHTARQMGNTWIVGVVTIGISLLSFGSPGLRYVNTAAGVWLAISSFAFPTISAGTTWNNVVVGLAIALVSLVPSHGESTASRPRRTSPA
jgi:hypothetical protein